MAYNTTPYPSGPQAPYGSAPYPAGAPQACPYGSAPYASGSPPSHGQTTGHGGTPSAPSAPPGPVEDEYKTKVELTISCQGLDDMDLMSKSDPCCCVDLGRPGAYAGQLHFVEIGRTEVIWDNLNPHFAKSVVLDYYFEEMQTLRFVVYDIDDESKPLRQGGADLIGEATTTLGQVGLPKSIVLLYDRL